MMMSLETNSTLFMQAEENVTVLNTPQTLNHSTHGLGGVQCVLSTGTVVMNILALIVFVRSNMELTTKLVLGQLAFSDLSVGIVTMVLFIPITFTQRFPYPAIWIQIFGFIQGVIYYATMYSVCLVTLERYVKICYPLKYDNWVTTKRIVFIVLFSWIFWALSIGIIVAIEGLYFDDTLLLFLPKGEKLIPFHIILGPVLSIFILVFCYIGILRETFKSKVRVRDISSIQNEDDVHPTAGSSKDTPGMTFENTTTSRTSVKYSNVPGISDKGKEDKDLNTKMPDHITTNNGAGTSDLCGEDKIKDEVYHCNISPNTAGEVSKSDQILSIHPKPKRTYSHIINTEPETIDKMSSAPSPASVVDTHKQISAVRNKARTAKSMTKSKEMNISNKKSLCSITLLITVFFVAYIPAFIVVALKDVYKENVAWAAGWLYIFTETNNFLNVLVYTVTFQPFRDAILHTFCKTYWRRKKRETQLQVA